MKQTEYYKNYKIEIKQIKNAESPDEWDDDGLFLIANHRDFYVAPPKASRKGSMNDARPYFESAIEDYKDTHHIFGLEAYIHSGVILSLSNEGNFCDRQWDVSQLGLVFASKKEWTEREEAKKRAKGLIETWNQYLSGEVYGFLTLDKEGNIIDSCSGYYGDDGIKQAIKAAKDIIDYNIKSITKKHVEKRKKDILSHVPIENRKSLTI